jgi:predicted  nucleic acid-binding Zn-ribbon protein
MTICIQCGLRAFVRYYEMHPDEQVTDDRMREVMSAARFDEEPEAHTKREHADPLLTQIERLMLNKRSNEILHQRGPQAPLGGGKTHRHDIH